MDGFRAFRRGGLEVGGALLGNRNGDVVHVRDHLRLECEHAYGPSFRLSRNDEAALAALLARARSEPRLAGLRPVGWYISHTRSDIRLRDSDLDTWDRLFPGPDGVLLIVRPENTGRARAQFYYRDENGSARTDLTAEFLLRPYLPGAGTHLADERDFMLKIEHRTATIEERPVHATAFGPAITDPPPEPLCAAHIEESVECEPIQAAPVRASETQAPAPAVLEAPAIPPVQTETALAAPRTVVIIERLPKVPELPEPRPENPVLDLRVWRRRWLIPMVLVLLGATLTGGAAYFHSFGHARTSERQQPRTFIPVNMPSTVDELLRQRDEALAQRDAAIRERDQAIAEAGKRRSKFGVR